MPEFVLEQKLYLDKSRLKMSVLCGDEVIQVVEFNTLPENGTFISLNKKGGIRKSKFKSPENHYCDLSVNRPFGGVWGCKYTPDKKYKSSWEKYLECTYEVHMANFGVPKDAYYVRHRKSAEKHCSLFSLKKDNRVIVLNNCDDYKNLLNIFSIGNTIRYSHPEYESESHKYDSVLDFETMSNFLIDGIYLTESGCEVLANKTWNDYGWVYTDSEKILDAPLRSWDVESLLLFNLDVIDKTEEIEFNE